MWTKRNSRIACNLHIIYSLDRSESHFRFTILYRLRGAISSFVLEEKNFDHSILGCECIWIQRINEREAVQLSTFFDIRCVSIHLEIIWLEILINVQVVILNHLLKGQHLNWRNISNIEFGWDLITWFVLFCISHI